MDSLFLRQVWAGNDAMLQGLSQKRSSSPHCDSDAGRCRECPSPLFPDQQGPGPGSITIAFVAGSPPKPEGANFYPAGATKAEVQRWLDSLSGEEKARATGFFTTIRRSPAGGFTAVPYSVEYQGELARAASLLREAADLTAQPTLKRFLTTRADAFLNDDYYASDVAWMELDSSIEPTIGPYEVQDEWFNFKAAFEAFITIRDEAESEAAVLFAPCRNRERAADRSEVSQSALGAPRAHPCRERRLHRRDANRGVQTAAFNLPNDERVVKEKGTKRVMPKTCRTRIHTRARAHQQSRAAAADQKNVSFEAFFTHILMHELMHGLGLTTSPSAVARRRSGRR